VTRRRENGEVQEQEQMRAAVEGLSLSSQKEKGELQEQEKRRVFN